MNSSVNIAGITLKNPVISASGTCGFGREYDEYYPVFELGAVCVKGLTLSPRAGNPPPRVAESPAGMLNSVGLQNPGVEAFIANELPWLKERGAVAIANASGNTQDEYVEMARLLSDTAVDMVELNLSCPNVKEGCMLFGVQPRLVEEVTRAAKAVCTKPIIVKLSPNVTDITEIAKAAEAGGADAVSLINTLLGMRIDIHSQRPVLGNTVGGLSGPAVLPVALRMVWQVASAVRIPVIGMGGISTGEDAVEFLLAGARAVAVGTACFVDPYAPLKIIEGIRAYMALHDVDDVNDLVGGVKV